MRAAMVESEPAVRNPIRGTCFGCCASANVTAARKSSVTNQTTLLFMALTFQRNVMPQNGIFENHNLWVKTAKGASHSCYRGSRFDSVRSSVYRLRPDGILSGTLFGVLLLRTADVANSCPPSYT